MRRRSKSQRSSARRSLSTVSSEGVQNQLAVQRIKRAYQCSKMRQCCRYKPSPLTSRGYLKTKSQPLLLDQAHRDKPKRYLKNYTSVRHALKHDGRLLKGHNELDVSVGNISTQVNPGGSLSSSSESSDTSFDENREEVFSADDFSSSDFSEKLPSDRLIKSINFLYAQFVLAFALALPIPKYKTWTPSHIVPRGLHELESRGGKLSAVVFQIFSRHVLILNSKKIVTQCFAYDHIISLLFADESSRFFGILASDVYSDEAQGDNAICYIFGTSSTLKNRHRRYAKKFNFDCRSVKGVGSDKENVSDVRNDLCHAKSQHYGRHHIRRCRYFPNDPRVVLDQLSNAMNEYRRFKMSTSIADRLCQRLRNHENELNRSSEEDSKLPDRSSKFANLSSSVSTPATINTTDFCSTSSTTVSELVSSFGSNLKKFNRQAYSTTSTSGSSFSNPKVSLHRSTRPQLDIQAFKSDAARSVGYAVIKKSEVNKIGRKDSSIISDQKSESAALTSESNRGFLDQNLRPNQNVGDVECHQATNLLENLTIAEEMDIVQVPKSQSNFFQRAYFEPIKKCQEPIVEQQKSHDSKKHDNYSTNKTSSIVNHHQCPIIRKSLSNSLISSTKNCGKSTNIQHSVGVTMVNGVIREAEESSRNEAPGYMIKDRQGTPQLANIIRRPSPMLLDNFDERSKYLDNKSSVLTNMALKSSYSFDDSTAPVSTVGKFSTSLYENLTINRRKSSSVLDLYRIADDDEHFVALCSVKKHEDTPGSSSEPPTGRISSKNNGDLIAVDSARTVAAEAGMAMSLFRRITRSTDASTRLTNLRIRQEQHKRLENWARDFDAILRDPAGLYAFSEFLNKQFCQENLNFWIACQNFKLLSNDQKSIQATKIYKRFFEKDCSEPINVDATAKHSIDENFSNGNIFDKIFDVAQDQIFHLMKFDCYPRFLKSVEYSKCWIMMDKGQGIPERWEPFLRLSNCSAPKQSLTGSANSLSKVPLTSCNSQKQKDKKRRLMLPWKSNFLGLRDLTKHKEKSNKHTKLTNNTIRCDSSSNEIEPLRNRPASSLPISLSERGLAKKQAWSQLKQSSTPETFLLQSSSKPDNVDGFRATGSLASSIPGFASSNNSLVTPPPDLIPRLELPHSPNSKSSNPKAVQTFNTTVVDHSQRATESLNSKVVQFDRQIIFSVDVPYSTHYFSKPPFNRRKLIGVQTSEHCTTSQALKRTLEKYSINIDEIVILIAGSNEVLPNHASIARAHNKNLVVLSYGEFQEWNRGDAAFDKKPNCQNLQYENCNGLLASVENEHFDATPSNRKFFTQKSHLGEGMLKFVKNQVKQNYTNPVSWNKSASVKARKRNDKFSSVKFPSPSRSTIGGSSSLKKKGNFLHRSKTNTDPEDELRISDYNDLNSTSLSLMTHRPKARTPLTQCWSFESGSSGSDVKELNHSNNEPNSSRFFDMRSNHQISSLAISGQALSNMVLHNC